MKLEKEVFIGQELNLDEEETYLSWKPEKFEDSGPFGQSLKYSISTPINMKSTTIGINLACFLERF